MTRSKPIIWTISGSDCSGGAGIAADVKTGHALGVEVCHLITANTVQNSQTLLSVNPVDVSILSQQAQLLLNDKMPSVIKVGLLANIEQVTWLAGFLTTLKQLEHSTKDSIRQSIKVVYDPVGHASVGGKFSNLRIADLKPLLKVVDVITPNSQEAQWLADSTSNNVKILAERINVLGVKSVIIKGGHALKEKALEEITLVDEDSTHVNVNKGGLNSSLNSILSSKYCFDYCLHTLTDKDSSKMSQDQTIEYGLRSLTINTKYSHGGGCSFASALAAFIAQGYLLRDALTLTKAFINQGLNKTAGKLDYYGSFEQTHWPNNKAYFPIVSSSVNDKYSDLGAFSSLAFNQESLGVGDNNSNKKLGLYPVIDSLYWLKRLLPLGLPIIQLRLKNRTEPELDVIIAKAIKLSHPYRTRLFINDHWQLAIKHGAYGVHIGQEDLQTTPLDKIHQAGMRLGISTHGYYEFLLAQQLQPSYLAIGAIYNTKTKNMTGQIQGINNLENILAIRNHIPVVAIGGINHQRAPEVLATGVDSIAVVTAITESKDPEKAVALFKELIDKQCL